jgi:putative thioredoxin
MSIDVTDATFETEVIDRSQTTPVVVDLWAPWCGPCRTLGPILDKVVGETGGRVALVKVNIDENPGIAQAFRVQSIPLVVAIKDGQAVDGFLGAYPEHEVRAFVERLLPSMEEDRLGALVAAGDEASLLAALDLDPGHAPAVVALATLHVESGRGDDALALLARLPETDDVRALAARARLLGEPQDDYDATLTALLDRVKAEPDARQEFLDILEVMGAADPRTATYRRALTSRLF